MPPIATSPILASSSPLPPVKPHSILRGSSTKRKRSEPASPSDGVDDALQDHHAALSAKKRKVAFSSEPSIHVLDDHGEKSATLVREEIRHAITQHLADVQAEYNEIVHILSLEPHDEDAVSDSLLSKYLVGLTSNASMLSRSCADLVHAALGMKWLDRDEKIVQNYIRFLSHLAISNSGYVSAILKMLVDNFAHISNSSGRLRPGCDRSLLYERVHAGLEAVINGVPSALSALSQTLTSSFPFIRDSKRAHVAYVRSLLSLANGFPELKGHILELITDRIVGIDVQVQIDVEDLEEDIGVVIDHTKAPLHQGDSQQTIEEEDDSDAGSEFDEDSEDLDPEEVRAKELKSSVEKLDAILDLCFDYCTNAFRKRTSSDAQSIFNLLITQFRTTILRTYRSRHTQFLLFHFAQSSPDFTTQFTDSCLQVLTDKSRSDVLKVSSAAYIASFVARGAHIDTETVVYAFDSLANYLDSSRKLLEPVCRKPELRKYSPYYAAVQALVYIFCFRWRDLLSDPEEHAEEDDYDLMDGRELTWAVGIKEAFTKNFDSILNPLKVSAPEMIEEFARLAHRLKFLYIYPILEANKKLRLAVQSDMSGSAGVFRETALTSLNGERHHQLDAYFPFDPFHLPVSKRWIAGEYNEWKGVPDFPTSPGVQEYGIREDSESDVDEETDDDEALEVGTATPEDDDV